MYIYFTDGLGDVFTGAQVEFLFQICIDFVSPFIT